MAAKLYELHGIHVFECAPDGPTLRTDRDAVDVIAKALEQKAKLIVVPISRLGEGFFDLRTRQAGEIVQKFVNYRLHLAILGDISGHVEQSESLEDFVREANRGDHIWFAKDATELSDRLARRLSQQIR